MTMKNSTILVTGGTGSFGHAFVPMALEKFNPERIIIYSRDEMKQWEMAKTYKDDSRVRFFIGDVRDRDRVYRALDNVDYVVHAAALKQVPAAEYNPIECIKTNIGGAQNVINAALETGVQNVVALSTDKACAPINLYGATKLASDKLFIAGNNYVGKGPTKFSIVRYGNVIGSRGSVIPLFIDQIKENKALTLTDPNMTRFMMTLEDAVDLVLYAFEHANQGDLFVQKAPSATVGTLAQALIELYKSQLLKILIYYGYLRIISFF